MSEPVDKVLYEKVKKKVYSQYKVHSAYRSALLVKAYKEAFEKKYPGKNAYTGEKKRGLDEWFSERWTNTRGETGYKYKSDVYRPTIRVDKKTPMTFAELGKKKIEKARRKKALFGRVKSFKVL